LASVQQKGLLLALTALGVANPLPNNGEDNGQGNDEGNCDNLSSRIKNVVVLVEENRSFDNFCGSFRYDGGIDGLLHTQYCNPVNVSDPKAGTVCAAPTAADVAPDDPPHGISGNNMQIFGTFHPVDSSPETMIGYVTEQATAFKTTNITRAAEAINYYSEEHVRVFEAMAKDGVLFDRWFCSVPGPTNPNRAYLTAGTSAGHGRYAARDKPIHSRF